MYSYMSKNEIAVAITADWNESEATTISQDDILELQSSAPEFGVLYEKGGRKLYAFLEGGTIRKKVIYACSGVLQDRDRTIPQIREKGFILRRLHRI